MFWMLATALTAILFCLILHYVKHFRLTKCYTKGRSFIAQRSNSQIKCQPQRYSQRRMSIVRLNAHIRSLRELHKKATWHCCLVEIDDEEFGFYPFAFLLYLLFLLIVSFLIMFKYIFIENDLNFETIFNNDIFINIQYENIITNINYSYHNFPSYSTQLSVMDWIIVYCVVIISSSESFFNFYRYISIQYSAKYMHSATPLYIIKHFSIYLFVFGLVFMTQIHFYYLLFPLVMCIYFGYNMYCTYAFHAIFVAQYKHSNILQEVADDMMGSVRLMRNISVFQCFISTIYIGMFSIINDINIYYYLPLVWCISCIGFTLNFVRNRQVLYKAIFTLYQCIRHCQIKKIIEFNMSFKRNSHSLSSSKNKIHQKNVDIIIHSDLETRHQTVVTPRSPITPLTPAQVRTPLKNDKSVAPKPLNTYADINQQIQQSDENIGKETNNNDNNPDCTDCKPSKALVLLGTTNMDMDIMASIDEENMMDGNDTDDEEIVDKCHFNSYSVDFGLQLQTKIAQFAVQTAGNQFDADGNNDYEGGVDLDNIECLEMTIKESSSEKVLNSEKYQQHKKTRLHRKRSLSKPKIIIRGPIMSKQSDNLNCINPLPVDSCRTPNINLSINKSRSDDLFNIDVAHYVMDLMVGNGFYSRKSWNSIQQLRRFQQTKNIHK